MFAPLIFGIVMTVGAVLLLIYRRQLLELFPDYESKGRPRVRRNSILRIVMFGTVVLALGLYIVLSNGLQFF
jgi:hypothetical protein